MKNKDVANAFLMRSQLSTTSLHSTGDKLFSYYTCIAQWLDGDTILGNSTKYSSTTSRHLGYIKSCIDKWTTKDVPRGEQSLLDYR